MKRFLHRLFVKNWGLKLFSVILAVILWLVLVPEEKLAVERILTVPLETSNIPASMELVEKPVSHVEVTFRAPNRLLTQVADSGPSVILNLENAPAYQEDYPLYPDMISLPTGVEVVRIFPNRVHLRLEETATLMLDVVPSIIPESLRPGYRLDKVEVDPTQVPVRGPKSKLNGRDKVRTVPIDLQPYVQNSDLQAELILPRPELRLGFDQMRVRVRLFISRIKAAAAGKSVQS